MNKTDRGYPKGKALEWDEQDLKIRTKLSLKMLPFSRFLIKWSGGKISKCFSGYQLQRIQVSIIFGFIFNFYS